MMLPEIPLPPLPNVGAPFYRPLEVELCEDAARNGDLKRVKELVQQLLYSPRPSSETLKPQPTWLYSSITTAIERHDLDMVLFLLDENVTTPDDLPFEGAVRCRAFEILELFLQRGWDINKPLHRNEPPVLSIPLCTGDKEMVIWLLDHGADPNARCAWDFTPTSQAMLCAPLDLIDYLFNSGGGDARRGELLQYAVLRDKPDALDIVRRAVEHGAPINKVMYEDEPQVFWEREPFGLGTPLHRAAEFGKVEIVKYLLEQGADPLKLDSRGKTPRYWADIKGHSAVVTALIHAEDQWSKILRKESSSL